jgi:hypothetical protein
LLSSLNNKKNATAANTTKATINPAAKITKVANRKLRHTHGNGAEATKIKDVGTKGVRLRAPADLPIEHGLCRWIKRNLGGITSVQKSSKTYAARQPCLNRLYYNGNKVKLAINIRSYSSRDIRIHWIDSVCFRFLDFVLPFRLASQEKH